MAVGLASGKRRSTNWGSGLEDNGDASKSLLSTVRFKPQGVSWAQAKSCLPGWFCRQAIGISCAPGALNVKGGGPATRGGSVSGPSNRNVQEAGTALGWSNRKLNQAGEVLR
jgi:hypothetical protein